MANISPFNALRPQAQYAKQVASKPYDVLNSKEAKEEARGNPYSFLHITKSEIDLPEDVDIHTAEVYEKAKDNLKAFIQREVLFTENKACYYIYRLVMNGKAQTGLVCASSIDDYEHNVIKKHEFTRPEKEQDRINHITITGAQTGNVFLAYKNVPKIDEIIEKWQHDKSPVYDFVADDNISHTVWVITDDKLIETITALFEEKVEATYIADGHHRAASAAKVRQAAKSKSSGYFLTTLFPASQLHIMDYNRLVKDLNGLSEEAFLQQAQEHFEIEKVKKAYAPEALHTFGMYLNRQWYKLTAKPGTYAEDPVGILDVTILQNNLLGKLLGIQDPRTDKRIDFVGGIRGLSELETRVNSGEMKIAFSLYPVTIQQLFDIADSGEVMPPKSTWFEPKLRDGLLTHLIYEVE
ncbi:MAG: DUF1015 domain-containing protein [Chitinophagaceae bacterium]|nr:DUF1015 domain-containing protein [Chitinophagaceae bacterium]MCW5925563.1 DUF1015 domain-containing protein [Chitinophagaceae bacterium]